MNDGPVDIHGWKPDDYEGRYEGEISLDARLREIVELHRGAIDAAKSAPRAVARDRPSPRHHVASSMNVPSLALGTSGVTPLELTGAYAPFANGGDGVIPFGIVRIKNALGQSALCARGLGSRPRRRPRRTRGDDATDGRRRSRPAQAKRRELDDRPSAGKTGTTQDFHDAWFVGFTADLVCGVWIGNDDNAPMVHATGGGLPAHIFKSFMEAAERDLPVKPLAGAPPVDLEPSPDATDAECPTPSTAFATCPEARHFDRMLNSLQQDGRSALNARRHRVAMQQRAIAQEPRLRRIGLLRQFAHELPEARSVMHVPHMRDFVGHDIVEHEGRGEDQPPGIR